jgi:hypothetical protein
LLNGAENRAVICHCTRFTAAAQTIKIFRQGSFFAPSITGAIKKQKPSNFFMNLLYLKN